jgi:hypothetical protein
MTAWPDELRLFPVEGQRAVRTIRYQVYRLGSPRGPGRTNLPLAVAHARSIAVAGHTAFVAGSDGTTVEIRLDGTTFVAITHGPGTWPEQCRRLLAQHGG